MECADDGESSDNLFLSDPVELLWASRLIEDLFELKPEVEFVKESNEIEEEMVKNAVDEDLEDSRNAELAEKLCKFFELRKMTEMGTVLYHEEVAKKAHLEDNKENWDNEYVQKGTSDYSNITLSMKQDKMKQLLLLYGEVLLESLRFLDSSQLTLFVYDGSISENDRDNSMFRKISNPNIRTLLISKTSISPRIYIEQDDSYIDEEFAWDRQSFASGEADLKSEYHQIDLNTWFCSCYKYQHEFTQTKPNCNDSYGLKLDEMARHLNLSQLHSKLSLSPIPMCGHLLAMLIMRYNFNEVASFFGGRLDEKYVDSKLWISLNSNLYDTI